MWISRGETWELHEQMTTWMFGRSSCLETSCTRSHSFNTSGEADFDEDRIAWGFLDWFLNRNGGILIPRALSQENQGPLYPPPHLIPLNHLAPKPHPPIPSSLKTFKKESTLSCFSPPRPPHPLTSSRVGQTNTPPHQALSIEAGTHTHSAATSRRSFIQIGSLGSPLRHECNPEAGRPLFPSFSTSWCLSFQPKPSARSTSDIQKEIFGHVGAVDARQGRQRRSAFFRMLRHIRIAYDGL